MRKILFLLFAGLLVFGCTQPKVSPTAAPNGYPEATITAAPTIQASSVPSIEPTVDASSAGNIDVAPNDLGTAANDSTGDISTTDLNG